ncbi:hypothetical protein Hanom_Chr00s000003g01606041 [Helianthus anomalus]
MVHHVNNYCPPSSNLDVKNNVKNKRLPIIHKWTRGSFNQMRALVFLDLRLRVWWGGGWAWVGAFVDTWLGVADMGRRTFKQGMVGRGFGGLR